MSAAFARRACLVLHAAGLTAEAASWRELAERSPERERVALLDVAEANEWLAGELTRLLATSAEAADLDTRHALPDRGEVDEPAAGDAPDYRVPCDNCGAPKQSPAVGVRCGVCGVRRTIDREPALTYDEALAEAQRQLEDDEVSVVACEDGHSGPGWYAHITEYPEEGSHFVGRVDSDRSPTGADVLRAGGAS